MALIARLPAFPARAVPGARLAGQPPILARGRSLRGAILAMRERRDAPWRNNAERWQPRRLDPLPVKVPCKVITRPAKGTKGRVSLVTVTLGLTRRGLRRASIPFPAARFSARTAGRKAGRHFSGQRPALSRPRAHLIPRIKCQMPANHVTRVRSRDRVPHERSEGERRRGQRPRSAPSKNHNYPLSGGRGERGVIGARCPYAQKRCQRMTFLYD